MLYLELLHRLAQDSRRGTDDQNLVTNGESRSLEKDLVASGWRSGLWLLSRDSKGKWKKTLIDADSGGYEHATYLKDLDGNGIDEIYVAADNQRKIRRYVWNGKTKTFDKTDILDNPRANITWNVVADNI